MDRAFIKMNGLGNDFVVVESGSSPFSPSAEEVRAIAERGRGIGCDQLISISSSKDGDAFMRIWNADGGEIAACGNGARCVGWLMLKASGRECVRIETAAGLLTAWRGGNGAVSIDMGAPGLDWRDIPLSRPMDTALIDLSVNAFLRAPGCVSMGNPHVVFFVPGADPVAIREVGPMIERDPLFPQGVNVGFAQIMGEDRIRLRVWERGAGLTRACGTGACAAVVAAHRRGLTGRTATVELDGGELAIQWREADGHVLMTGPVVVEFTGRLPGLARAA
jgi:diaminopimelate epimerase